MTTMTALHYQQLQVKNLDHLLDVCLNSNFGKELSNINYGKYLECFIDFRHTSTKATLIALFCTFFEIFNIPVFWPILLFYFIALFCVTMKKQIKVSK